MLGDLDKYMPKLKLYHQITLYTKIHSRFFKDLNISCDTIKVLKEKIGRKISDILCSNIFTDTSSGTRDIKEIINNEECIKLKSLCPAVGEL